MSFRLTLTLAIRAGRTISDFQMYTRNFFSNLFTYVPGTIQHERRHNTKKKNRRLSDLEAGFGPYVH